LQRDKRQGNKVLAYWTAINLKQNTMEINWQEITYEQLQAEYTAVTNTNNRKALHEAANKTLKKVKRDDTLTHEQSEQLWGLFALIMSEIHALPSTIHNYIQTTIHYIHGLGDEEADHFVRHMTHKLYNVSREANFIRAELCQSGIIEMHEYLREVGYYADDNCKALIFKKKQ
jgi:hypothetical protein